MDYTQDDFSGVLDRKALVEHLCKVYIFQVKNKGNNGWDFDNQTIFININSVEKHVCTWLNSSINGYTTRTKVCNKIVAQLKRGHAEKFDGKLCEYMDCHSDHLCKTFLHPDVQERE